MGADTIGPLTLLITGDASGGNAALDAVRARMGQVSAAMVQKTNEINGAVRSLRESQKMYNDAVVSGAGVTQGFQDNLAQEATTVNALKAEMSALRTQLRGTSRDYLSVTGQAEQATTSIYESLAGLRHFRMLFASTIGFASFGFWFMEWGRLLGGVKSAIQDMEGFGASAQKAFAQLVKGADEALIHVQGLTTAQKIAETQALITETEQRINLDISERTAIVGQSYWHNLAEEIKGLVAATSGNVGPITDFISQFAEKDAAFKDQMQQGVLLMKQFAALRALEKDLREEQKKGVDEDARRARGAKDYLAALQQEVDAEERLQKIRGFSLEPGFGGAHGGAPTFEEWERQQRQHNAAIMRQAQEHQRLQRELDQAASPAARRKGSETAMGTVGGLRAGSQETEPFLQGNLRQVQASMRQAAQAARQENDRIVQSYQNMAKSISNSLEGVGRSLGEFVAAHKTTFAQMGPTLQGFAVAGAAAAQDMQKFATGVIAAGVAAGVEGNSIGAAMKRAAAAALLSIAEQSAAYAVFALAKGLLDEFWNPPAAASEFAAAELFGGLAVGAGAAGAMLSRQKSAQQGAANFKGAGSFAASGAGMSSGSGSSSGGGSGYGSGGSGSGSGGGGSGQQVVPGGNFPSAPKNGNLTIAIMGEQESGQWLANTLNNVIQQGGASLTATHTTAVPNPMA